MHQPFKGYLLPLLAVSHQSPHKEREREKKFVMTCKNQRPCSQERKCFFVALTTQTSWLFVLL